MALIALLPVILSILVLGAHFFRAGNLLLVAVCLALLALVAVRRAWAARALQVALVIGAAEWARTLYALASERAAAGEPYMRLCVILGCVGAVALLSALVFLLPSVNRWFRMA
jgi:hypothetical protein